MLVSHNRHPYLPISSSMPNQLHIARLTGEQADNNPIVIYRKPNSVVVGDDELDLKTPTRVVVVKIVRNNYVVPHELKVNEILRVDGCMIQYSKKLHEDRAY